MFHCRLLIITPNVILHSPSVYKSVYKYILYLDINVTHSVCYIFKDHWTEISQDTSLVYDILKSNNKLLY